MERHEGTLKYERRRGIQGVPEVAIAWVLGDREGRSP